MHMINVQAPAGDAGDAGACTEITCIAKTVNIVEYIVDVIVN